MASNGSPTRPQAPISTASSRPCCSTGCQRQARHFAQVSGCRVRTDRVDAGMLASMAVVMPLRPTQPLSETQRSLQSL